MAFYTHSFSTRPSNFLTQRKKIDTEVTPAQMIPIWGMDSSIAPNMNSLPIVEPITNTAAKNTTIAVTNINHVAVLPHLDIFSTSLKFTLIHNFSITSAGT